MIDSTVMRPSRLAPILAALLALSGHSTLTAQSPSRIDVSKLGPQAGDRVPGFSLKDQNGKTTTLESIMGPKGAMLVFFRSAGFNPVPLSWSLDMRPTIFQRPNAPAGPGR